MASHTNKQFEGKTSTINPHQQDNTLSVTQKKETIQNSEWFLLVWSHGILLSKSCLEEMKCAMELEKQIVIIYDFSYKAPNVLPKEWLEVEGIIQTTSHRLSWMPIYASACIAELKKRVGPSDRALKDATKIHSGNVAFAQALQFKFTLDTKLVTMHTELLMTPNVVLAVLFEFSKKNNQAQLQIFKASGCVCDGFDLHLLKEQLTVHDVDLSSASFSGNAHLVLAHLPKSTERLNLSNCQEINDTTLEIIGKNLHDMHRINLDHCSNITVRGLVLMCEHCTKLESVSLRGCTGVDASSLDNMNHTFLTEIQIVQ